MFLFFLYSRIPIANVYLSRKRRQAQDAIIEITNSDTSVNLSDEKGSSLATPVIGSERDRDRDKAVVADERTTKRSVPVSTSIRVNDVDAGVVPKDTTVKAVIEVKESPLASSSSSTTTNRVPKLIMDDAEFGDVPDNHMTATDNLLDNVNNNHEDLIRIASLTDANAPAVAAVINGENSNELNKTGEEESEDYDEYDYYGDDYYDYSNEPKNDPEQDHLADELPPDVYCDLIETLNDKCLETSILEIWKYDEEVIRSLTKEDIIKAINEVKESPHFGHEFDYTGLLGDIKRDENGSVVAAKSAIHVWVTSVDQDAIMEDVGGAGIELDLADEVNLAWENEVIDTMLDFKGQGLTVLANVARRFVHIISAHIQLSIN